MTKIMDIYLVRHGQTEWNVEERLQGWSDSPLTPLGRAKAEALSKELALKAPGKIYTSDLGRALTTAEILRGDLKIPILKRSELRELALGPWEGHCFHEVKASDAEKMKVYFNEPQNHHLEGIEDYHDLMVRIHKFMDELKTLEEESVVVVAHGVSIAAIVNIIEDRPLEDFWERPLVDDLSITHIQWNQEKFTIQSLGDEIKGSSY